MDCGHYIKRQNQATRYSEENCQLQCKSCNNFKQGNDVKFRNYLVEKYGEGKVLLLESSRRQTYKRSKNDLEFLAEYYKKKVKELLQQKGIEKWW